MLETTATSSKTRITRLKLHYLRLQLIVLRLDVKKNNRPSTGKHASGPSPKVEGATIARHDYTPTMEQIEQPLGAAGLLIVLCTPEIRSKAADNKPLQKLEAD